MEVLTELFCIHMYAVLIYTNNPLETPEKILRKSHIRIYKASQNNQPISSFSKLRYFLLQLPNKISVTNRRLLLQEMGIFPLRKQKLEEGSLNIRNVRSTRTEEAKGEEKSHGILIFYRMCYKVLGLDFMLYTNLDLYLQYYGKYLIY